MALVDQRPRRWVASPNWQPSLAVIRRQDALLLRMMWWLQAFVTGLLVGSPLPWWAGFGLGAVLAAVLVWLHLQPSKPPPPIRGER